MWKSAKEEVPVAKDEVSTRCSSTSMRCHMHVYQLPLGLKGIGMFNFSWVNLSRGPSYSGQQKPCFGSLRTTPCVHSVASMPDHIQFYERPHCSLSTLHYLLGTPSDKQKNFPCAIPAQMCGLDLKLTSPLVEL